MQRCATGTLPQRGANRVALQQGDAGTCAGMRIEPIYRPVQIPKVVTGLAAITQHQALASRLHPAFLLKSDLNNG